MAITVGTTATHPELVLLETVKSELGITGSSDDGVLANYIKRASAAIKSYCNRDFVRETITETRPGNGRRKMLLTRRPIVSVSAVTFDGSTQSSTSYSIDDAAAGVLWKENGWTGTGINTNFITLRPTHEARRDWSFTYIAGYIPPGSTEGESDLPADIEYAAAETVKAWYLARQDNPNIRTQRVGDASETKFTEATDFGLPPVVQTVLAKWRSIDLTVD